MNDVFLLDTCTIIFSATDVPLRKETEAAISKAAFDSRIRMSPISAWEIGMAMSKGKISSPYSPIDFFNRFRTVSGAALCALTPEILVNSSYLPGRLHGDPMDRILVATAREYDLTLITRDQAILAYGSAGHVKTLPC